ncbi:MAG: vitamin K epoxide reductase family protein [Thermoprotei archaeon]|nr:vitamin K epoxide reductase family protein [Thermoprotei archaeon]
MDLKGSIIILASLAGFGGSLWGYYSFVRGGENPVCRPGSKVDCLAVYSLPQAWVLGFHLSFLAPWYYVLKLVLGFAAVFSGFDLFFRALAIAAWGGLLLVPYLVYLELRVARAICVYCTIMHVSTLALALATFNDLLKALGFY